MNNISQIFENLKKYIFDNFGDYVSINYYDKNNNPLFLIIYDTCNNIETKLYKIKDEFDKLKQNENIGIIFFNHPLISFETYEDNLDLQFDDRLIINYKNYDINIPVFEITYTNDIDETNLREAIPNEWKELEKLELIKIKYIVFDINNYEINPIVTELQNEFIEKIKNIH